MSGGRVLGRREARTPAARGRAWRWVWLAAIQLPSAVSIILQVYARIADLFIGGCPPKEIRPWRTSDMWWN